MADEAPAAAAGRRVALGIAYAGERWHGWQSQPDGRTLQDRVEAALSAFAAVPVKTVCAGRTDTGVHATRHLGAFSVAYGVGLLVDAVRPARARTMLPVAAVLSGALLVTAIVDLLQGRVPLLGEATHLPEMISVLLIWMLANPRRPRSGASRRPSDGRLHAA